VTIAAAPAISVAIPAHNEAGVIERTLRALFASINGAGIENAEVVVVANACTDDTAQVVNRFAHQIADPPAAGVAPRLRVIETDTPGKTNALNLADAALTLFPRWYVDADIAISENAVRDVHASLARPGVCAAAPRMSFDLSQSSAPVCAYYRTWQRMPYFDHGPLAGAYALTRDARARWTTWPDVISDDGFARLHFQPHERVSVRSASMTVLAPRTWPALLRIKARSRAGGIELRERFPDLFANEDCAPQRSAKRLLRKPARWPDAAVYALANLIATRRARAKLDREIRGESRSWERDDTSRAR
jgi:glycosyltransferase involved in cell wall biosynthesis